MYNLLFQTSAAALQTLALDATYLGGQIGMLGGLHTWTRDMAYHPPVHSLVPAGALASDGSRWLSPRYEDWLVPVRALSRIFRGKFKEAFAKAALLGDVPTRVWQQPWVTHCKPAGTGTEVLSDFAPYIRRIAITTNRIDKLEDGHVTFHFKESTSKGWQRRTLPAHEFIRRFLQHVLPKGFIKVRYYGFLSPTCRQSLTPIRPLLAASSCRLLTPYDGKTRQPHDPRPTPPQTRHCPICHGQLVFIRHLSRPTRAPP